MSVNRISYSFGMVDLMHFGHINALRKACENSDLSIFGLVSDEASDAWFGSHVSNEEERRSVLESIKYVDEVWSQSTFDPLDNLRTIHAKYPDAVLSLFTGNEWGVLSAQKYVESIGGRVVKLDYYDKLSPQTILDTLNKNETHDKPLNNNLISTKANTLQSLKSIITKARIEDIFIVTVDEFRQDADRTAAGIIDTYRSGKIVVRSSSKHEDAFEESNAGHFTSVLNVDVNDTQAVKQAIADVITSYGKNAEGDEQVLIQRQTENVLISGVVFTRDIQRNRPYYVINYDESGSTDSVTSGIGGISAWMSHSVSRESVPGKWRALMEAVRELEDILSGILLDIEFAITAEEVVIFQVRPLAAAYKFGRNNNKEVETAGRETLEKYSKRKQSGLTCFSDMAFWNPAEIIGDNPKNLDFSLYREIITKSAWNIGLIPMGYRAVPKELMFRFGNKPYISVERSFEALMPAAVSDRLAVKLGKYYIDRLKQDLSAHDKIEFEISHNVFDFSLHNRLADLMKYGFSTEEVLELENALKALTIRNISAYKDTLASDLEDLKQLEGVRLDIQNITKGSKDFRLIAKSIHTLLDAVDKLGTPQFSRHARCAFMAKSLCRSLVAEGYISSDDFNRFMSGINTIAVDYDRDYHAVLDGRMTKDTFNLIYGHLRAGTYNIRSPRYDQMEQLFTEAPQSMSTPSEHENDDACEGIIKTAAEKAMSDSGIKGISGEELISFIKLSTEQRESFAEVCSQYSITSITSLSKFRGTLRSDIKFRAIK